jgi:hypothetical protein
MKEKIDRLDLPKTLTVGEVGATEYRRIANDFSALGEIHSDGSPPVSFTGRICFENHVVPTVSRCFYIRDLGDSIECPPIRKFYPPKEEGQNG